MRRQQRACAAALTIAIGLAGVATPVARADWSKSYTLAPAGRSDHGDPLLAVSASGAATAAFDTFNSDRPGSAQAWIVPRAAGGGGTPRRITGTAQVLALAYRGSSLRALLGTTTSGLDCCSAVATATVGVDGSVGRGARLIGRLAGASEGRLIALGGGRMLAAVATERGVWAAQSAPSGVFAAARLISLHAQEPAAMDAVWLGAARTLVAWTAGTGVAGSLAPRTIDVAPGSARSGPTHVRAAITVSRGHRVDALALARRGASVTATWIESWTDRHGFHSRVEAADLGGAHPRIRPLSPAGRLASDLAAAGDPGGDEGVSWKACTTAGSCVTQAAGRGTGRGFGSARTLGPADAVAAPSLAISPAGQIVVGWVHGGRPVASVGFGRATTLAAATGATGIDVTYGTRRQALAAWVQGTLTPSVQAAAYRAG